MKPIGKLVLFAGFLLLLGAQVAPAALAEGVAHTGGVGGSLGLLKFVAGDDWKDGSMRFSGQAVFKYHITDAWGITLEGGAGWNNMGGTGPQDTLAVVYPFTLGGQYRFHAGDTPFFPTIGAGIGIYSLGIKDTPSSWAEETGPGTQNTGERLNWIAPGFFGRVGTEYMFTDTVAMHFDALFHYVASEDDRFTRFGENMAFIQFRVGVNYYFGVGGGDDGGSEAAPDDDEGN